MKIVHICLTGGYTEGFTYQENYLAKYHAKMGHDVTLISTQFCWHKDKWGACTDSNYVNKDKVKIIRIPYKYKIAYKLNTYLGRFVGLYDLLEQIEPNIIFIHNMQFLDVDKIVRYAKKHKVRIYADNHADFSNSARSKLAVLFYKIVWRHTAQMIEPYTTTFYGVLPARVDFLKKIYKLPASKCELLVMGADDEEVKRAATKQNINKIKRQFNFNDNDFVIVTGGKIDAWKTQTLLLMQAVSELIIPNVKLLIFGSVSAEIKDEFNHLFNKNIMRYVSWADTTAAYDYFAIADLVVFPGRHSVYWEQVVAQGKPMLCKLWEGTTHIDIGGNVEFLKNDSSEEIKAILEDLLTNTEKYRKMCDSAEKSDKNMFYYAEIAKKSIGETK